MTVKKAFFENASSAFKRRFQRISASYEDKLHMFEVPKYQGNLLVVIRTSLDIRIRFYWRKRMKTSFFQKWYSDESFLELKKHMFLSLSSAFFDHQKIFWHFLARRLHSKILLGVLCVQQSGCQYLKIRQSVFRVSFFSKIRIFQSPTLLLRM